MTTMTHAFMGCALAGVIPATYPDVFLDDLSRNLALPLASRRQSRGSNGQRSGSAMRVLKPTSANNSPRSSSATQARRRTLMMHDGNLARRMQQAVDHVQMPEYSSVSRPSRPVSWHLSTLSTLRHQPFEFQHKTQYPVPTSTAGYETDSYPAYFPPTPAAYSGNTSPTASFSPLSAPLGAYDTSSNYIPGEGWNAPHHGLPAYISADNTYVEPFPALPTTLPGLSPPGITSWKSNPLNGFSNTSPPTPETLPQAQQPQPVVASEDTIRYQPLDEPEEEGEILFGMGLYDAPDRFDNGNGYGMSSLLAAPCRTGKGLKLEESWQPPEESDDDTGLEDADGEDSE